MGIGSFKIDPSHDTLKKMHEEKRAQEWEAHARTEVEKRYREFKARFEAGEGPEPSPQLQQAHYKLNEAIATMFTVLTEQGLDFPDVKVDLAQVLYATAVQLAATVNRSWLNFGSFMGIQDKSMLVFHTELITAMTESFLRMETSEDMTDGALASKQAGGHCAHQAQAVDVKLSNYMDAVYTTADLTCMDDGDPIKKGLQAALVKPQTLN